MDRFQLLKLRLNAIVRRDVDNLVVKEKEYGRSWCKRGGVGAAMMLLRKVDRIETRLKEDPEYNIFRHISQDKRPEGIIDDIRDLRAYLLLVEEEMMNAKVLEDVLLNIEDYRSMEGVPKGLAEPPEDLGGSDVGSEWTR
jgi:hypothetical protein